MVVAKCKDTCSFDVVIVGAGPAGASAAIYLGTTFAPNGITIDNNNGVLEKAGEINNYPGFLGISGIDLVDKFKAHIKEYFGFMEGEIENVTINDKPREFLLKIKGENTIIRTKVLVVASGFTPRELGAKGEKKFEKKGISYCALCDGFLYKDKEVAVIGGGVAALREVKHLASICKKVYLLHRRREFKAFPILIEEIENLAAEGRVEILFDTEVKEFKGNNKIETLKITTVGVEKELRIDGVFIAIGSNYNSNFCNDLAKIKKDGKISINKKQEVIGKDQKAIKGFYACGGVVGKGKQIVEAVESGYRVAIEIENYLND